MSTTYISSRGSIGGQVWCQQPVIPAPKAYIKVVAVKTLVVGFRVGPSGLPMGPLFGAAFFPETAATLN